MVMRKIGNSQNYNAIITIRIHKINRIKIFKDEISKSNVKEHNTV